MYKKNINLTWNRSTDCPLDQLAEVTYNKYNVLASLTTFIKQTGEGSPSEGNYTWEDVGLQTNLKDNIPELFTPQNSYSIFQNNEGIRVVNKHLVTFSNRKEVIKAFNKLGFITFTEIDEGFLIDKNIHAEYLTSISEINTLDDVSVIQRKKYNVSFISTGIYIESNKLVYLHFLPSFTLNTCGVINSNFILSTSNELLVAIHSCKQNTIIKKGDMLGYLVPQHNTQSIKLTQHIEYGKLRAV